MTGTGVSMEAEAIGQKAGAEEAADFARVAAMVGEPVSGAGDVVQATPEVPAMDPAESIAGLAAMAAGVAEFAGLQNVAALWSPEACREFGEKTVPVLRKYPWGARVLAFFETGAGVEEMALGAFVLPMGFATWKAFKADTAKPEETQAGGEERPRAVVEVASGELREVTR